MQPFSYPISRPLDTSRSAEIEDHLQMMDTVALAPAQRGLSTHIEYVEAESSTAVTVDPVMDRTSENIENLYRYPPSARRLINDILTIPSLSTSSRSSGSIYSVGSSMYSLETPLMVRIRFGPSEVEDIQEVIDANTSLDIDARNVQGETALHISVKLGNINATQVLLGRGANVHARNNRRHGVLEVAEWAQRRTKENESLYARITACMALAIDAGAVSVVQVVTHGRDSPIATWPQRYFNHCTKHQISLYYT